MANPHTGYPQQHVPLLDSVACGGMVDEFTHLYYVHTEVSDSTSSDEESMVKAINAKKSKVTSFKTWPRFLIIGSTDEGALRKLSPFAINKGLQGLAGNLKSVKKLRNGTLLVECATDSHSRNLLKS